MIPVSSGVRSTYDRGGLCFVRSGHTVHLGASTGLVLTARMGIAKVRWISGVESSHKCELLTVVRHLGRVKFVPDVPLRSYA